MDIKLTTDHGVTYLAEKTPMKRGGEGAIHRVISAQDPPLVAKIWHAHQKANSAKHRIQWMIDHSPLKNAPPSVQNSIIWPKDLVYRNRKFVGYTMSLVPDAVKLFSLTQPGFPDHQWGKQWHIFGMPAELRNRLIVCYNLVQAVDFLHKAGSYQVVDMKPENILIKPSGHISLIDMDSIQIHDNGRMLFPATVFTPEYSPPEFHQKTFIPGVTEFSKQHDLFSLAVVLYQIIVNVHPFQASHPTNTAVHQNIMDGLWVHGPNKKELHRIPHFHDFYHQLPQSIKDLFHQTFDAGHTNPVQRVTPDQWTNTLLNEIKSLSNAPRQKRKPYPTTSTRKITPKKPKPATNSKKNHQEKIVMVVERNYWVSITTTFS